MVKFARLQSELMSGMRRGRLKNKQRTVCNSRDSNDERGDQCRTQINARRRRSNSNIFAEKRGTLLQAKTLLTILIFLVVLILLGMSFFSF